MIRKILVIILAIMVLVNIGACQNQETKNIVGEYTCIKSGTRPAFQNFGDLNDVLQLMPDNTFIFGAPNQPGLGGEWKSNGSTITLTVDIFGIKMVFQGEVSGSKINLDDGSVWVKDYEIDTGVQSKEPSEDSTAESAEVPVIELESDSSNTKPATKVYLINALKDLRQSMLETIRYETEKTASVFVDVKDYWQSKRWADFFKVPLRSIENTLSVLSAFVNVADFVQGVNQQITIAKSTTDVLASVLTYHDAQEIQGNFQIALNGPDYVDTIQRMLDEADDSIMAPFGREFPTDDSWKLPYQQIVQGYLYGTKEGPVKIARFALSENRNIVSYSNGTLAVHRSISEEFNSLIEEIENNPLPTDFPLDDVVLSINNLKHDIIQSRTGNTEVRYTNHIGRSSTITLGAIAEWVNALITTSTAVARKLEVEEIVEGIKAGGAILTYVSLRVPGYVPVKIVTQSLTLAGIMIEPYKKTFPTNPEEAFYMIPQNMVLGLPIEVSNLWKVADETNYYLRSILRLDIPVQEAIPLDSEEDLEINDNFLTIGYSICYTGKAAERGRPMGDGKLDCFKYINEELGGVAGYQVEVIWRDNGYDASKATTIVNEFIDSGCLLFTTCSSAMMTASAEIANRADFPGIAVFSSPTLTNPPKHIYAQTPDYGDEWAAFAKYYLDNIWKGPGKPKMALHLVNNSAGAGARDAAEALAGLLGIELVAIEEHSATTISEIESMTRIKRQNPDILFISSTPQPTSIIVKNAVELGLYPGMEIACGHASFTSKLVELAGDDAEGVYGVYPTVNWGDDVPAMAKMVEYCQKYHPEDMGNMDYITTWAESLIVAEILRLAIVHVGVNHVDELTPQMIEEYGFKKLNNFEVGGLHGPVSYVEGDNRLSKSVRVVRVQNGEIIPVSGWVEAPLIPYSFE